MAQQTKTRSQQSEVVEETAPDTSRSKEVVEEASCCLTNIDDLLDECDKALPDPEPEVVEVVLPEWHPDAEYDPNDGVMPSKPTAKEVVAFIEERGGDSDAIFALMEEAEEAFDERFEAYSALYLSASQASAARVRNGCVC